METLRDAWPHDNRRAVKALNIIVVGAGIGGLTSAIALAQTGHNVTVLERFPAISEIGAGIQITPNASRILHRLGALQSVMERATVLSGISVRGYASDNETARVPLMPANGIKYGAPMGVIHRGDLQSVLLGRALELGCRVLTNHKVLAVDESFSARVKVCLAPTGTKIWMSADLVIAADGVKSAIRRQIMNSRGCKDEPVPTGDAAYRLLIPRERVLGDPLLLSMMDQNMVVRYMGPGGHVVTYPVRKGSLYNIVLLHPAKEEALSDDVWTTQGSREEMLQFYSGWSPAIRGWLSHADMDVLEWVLYVYPSLPTWIQGRVALLGDACHPMLPYVAQGAAAAIEDAAVLATALTCTASLPLALRMYEAARKPRAERIAACATATARVLHLPDGPRQVARDRWLADPGNAARNPDRFINSRWQDFMWGVDVMEETLRMWTRLAKVLPLEMCYPRIQKAYSYTLYMDMSRGCLLRHLIHQLRVVLSRGGYKTHMHILKSVAESLALVQTAGCDTVPEVRGRRIFTDLETRLIKHSAVLISRQIPVPWKQC